MNLKEKYVPKNFFWAIDECRGHHSAENLKKVSKVNLVLKSRLWKPSFGITALNDQEIREVSFFEGRAVSGNFDV